VRDEQLRAMNIDRAQGDTVQRPLRIGLLAGPMLAIPPSGYAGTERIVGTLARELHRRGHEVTVFATGDSQLPCEVIPVLPRALWREGYQGDVGPYIALAVSRAWKESRRFDVIHSHVETAGFLFARHSPTPVVSTLHGRLDVSGYPQLIDEFSDIPLVAISESQRRWSPDARWVATIHHGLDFSGTPVSHATGTYLLVIGRASPEKGIAEAIEVARAQRIRLVMALKVHDVREHAMYHEVIAPAVAEGVVEWRGEVTSSDRDALMAGALATLMLGSWPEPFGLVAIESMATGTPVIGRRAGGLTETIVHGATGFLVDDMTEAAMAVSQVAGLDRAAISAYARTQFDARRMTTQYERVYRALAEAHGTKRMPMRDLEALPIGGLRDEPLRQVEEVARKS
jgi:glycosyltransferase involved in cell wall biosynthesis